MRDRRLEGYWWLPGREENKIAGVLSYDGTEPTLRLFGAFQDTQELSPRTLRVQGTDKAPLIMGSSEGKHVTLVDCHQRNFSAKFALPRTGARP